MLADTLLRHLLTDQYVNLETEAGPLPSLLDTRIASCPDGPPRRGQQNVLLRYIRVQQVSCLKGARPW